eukprot:gnl/TRDRNA2_/TRDRNA2_151726_c1_seq1.p1 gnl/TRDRNA2_/TRDRNA2_151726_c1~~gnl/TRDRNA2_/TRDRNA2_151726_c1_seq1.p1  ORF type:complete len:917 (-),score=184.19 gnl/TRDRNA2_/TRDRNA2_151726_c1_seq1:18-2702(-)
MRQLDGKEVARLEPVVASEALEHTEQLLLGDEQLDGQSTVVTADGDSNHERAGWDDGSATGGVDALFGSSEEEAEEDLRSSRSAEQGNTAAAASCGTAVFDVPEGLFGRIAPREAVEGTIEPVVDTLADVRGSLVFGEDVEDTQEPITSQSPAHSSQNFCEVAGDVMEPAICQQSAEDCMIATEDEAGALDSPACVGELHNSVLTMEIDSELNDDVGSSGAAGLAFETERAPYTSAAAGVDVATHSNSSATDRSIERGRNTVHVASALDANSRSPDLATQSALSRAAPYCWTEREGEAAKKIAEINAGKDGASSTRAVTTDDGPSRGDVSSSGTSLSASASRSVPSETVADASVDKSGDSRLTSASEGVRRPIDEAAQAPAPEEAAGEEAMAARAAATVAAAVAVRPAKGPIPGPVRARDRDDVDRDRDVWCNIHFQYRWRCRQDGVDVACCGPAPAARGAAAGAPAAADPLRSEGGVPQAGVGPEGDEELEDLEFQRLEAELEDERAELQEELRRAKRGADMVTPEMEADVKGLLRLFGIPWVQAPAEAEAQCAFLSEARLVDAIATDDSDGLAFGAKEVYRRLFSDDHPIECYTSARLEARLGLLWGDTVALAMLLGCDYTLGVHGVGIVNGLEVVRAFAPGQRGPGARSATDAASDAWLAELRALRGWAQNVAGWDQDSAGVESTDRKAVASFKKAHKNYRTQWSFPEDFPSAEVFDAFVRPLVDRSLEPFSWAQVDADSVLGQLTAATGLGEEKLRERLDPALRRYTDTLRQPRITEYMAPVSAGDVAVVRSDRMNAALRGLRGEACEEDDADEDDRPQEGKRRRAARRDGGDTADATAGEKPKRAPKRRRAEAKANGDAPVAAAPVASLWILRPSSGVGAIDLDLDDEM